ncbi:agmatinase [Enhygromyxa salina]|uniref:Agmatinase n=1 Tax=Enhygromyxa salina TaxID=215803 RepID=A0A2S9YLQ5_9BACT|nr:agmatinase [Enhygromyxa salina]PRQ05988.1 Agmatinase [Enhygromyxa salina]
MNTTTRFLGAGPATDAGQARAALVGVPYDGAVTYRSGASEGPDGLRLASDSIETYCPKLDRSLDEFGYVDFGDLVVDVPEPGAIAGATPGERLVRSLRKQLDALPVLPLVAIGGDHLVAYPFVERALEQHPNLQIIHVDAHMDLRAAWDGEPYNHATVLGRLRDRMGPDHRLHQWGIRSGERTEYQLAADDPRIELLGASLEPMAARVRELLAADLPIYVTLDVDGIDPADIPGTGTPEPDGLRFGVVEAALGLLASAPTKGPGLIGADVVELAPAIDPTGRSQVAVARLVRTLLLGLVRASA